MGGRFVARDNRSTCEPLSPLVFAVMRDHVQ